MKKVATFFAIAAVVALSACGSKSTEESTETTPDTAVVETPMETAPVDTMTAPADTMHADTTAH
jgi:hypothetical protein